MQQKSFYLLLAVVSVAFCFVLWPFSGAVFWGAILAIIFTPSNNWLTRRMGGRRNLASLTTLTLCLLIVVLPLIFVTGALIQEGSTTISRHSVSVVSEARLRRPPMRRVSQLLDGVKMMARMAPQNTAPEKGHRTKQKATETTASSR